MFLSVFGQKSCSHHSHAMPLLASFWIAQADTLYALVSTSLLLAVVLLVLRPGNR